MFCESDLFKFEATDHKILVKKILASKLRNEDAFLEVFDSEEKLKLLGHVSIDNGKVQYFGE